MKKLALALALSGAVVSGALMIPSGNKKTIMQLCNKKVKLNKKLLPNCTLIADVPEDYKSGGDLCVPSDGGECVIDQDKKQSKEKFIIDLSAACGFETTELSWACCPQCLERSNGCPPCSALCKYQDDWPGHESECDLAP